MIWTLKKMDNTYTLLEAALRLKVSTETVRKYVQKGMVNDIPKLSPRDPVIITKESVDYLSLRFQSKDRLIKANQHDGNSKSHRCICRECTLVQEYTVCKTRTLNFDLLTNKPMCLDHLEDGRI